MHRFPLKHRRRTRPLDRPRVLQISDDQNLAVTRLLLLHNNGYCAEHVSSAQLSAAMDLCEFEVFLICQSISPNRAASIMKRIRAEVSAARILRIRATGELQEEGPDVSLDPPARPWNLMRALELLASRPAGELGQQGQGAV